VNPGDLAKYDHRTRHEIVVVIRHVQHAWGANRYQVLFPSGELEYVWDKHMEKVEPENE